ncbi:hypothetical protein [Yinghuangia seranimata]|uniref:hypothetical protein n=1 Tax=Yinghuangia seranimata TaxID=408067 RepID=UPI00248C7DC4|nr:hypothetical protein [Yinghuangia seranimata]MDI2127627.1 hypothetical protein [Yinghuangia seranimata]
MNDEIICGDGPEAQDETQFALRVDHFLAVGVQALREEVRGQVDSSRVLVALMDRLGPAGCGSRDVQRRGAKETIALRDGIHTLVRHASELELLVDGQRAAVDVARVFCGACRTLADGVNYVPRPDTADARDIEGTLVAIRALAARFSLARLAEDPEDVAEFLGAVRRMVGRGVAWTGARSSLTAEQLAAAVQVGDEVRGAVDRVGTALGVQLERDGVADLAREVDAALGQWFGSSAAGLLRGPEQAPGLDAGELFVTAVPVIGDAPVGRGGDMAGLVQQREELTQLTLRLDAVRQELVKVQTWLGRVRPRVDGLVVDVSGADLSDFGVRERSALGGVVWTKATIWPDGYGDWVAASSRELGEGRFQVRGDTDPVPAPAMTSC